MNITKMIMNKGVYSQLVVLLSVVLSMSLFSCCNNPVEKVSKKRNILFYIGADSDLDGDALNKINQMRYGWQPGFGEMLIYVDRSGDGAYLFRMNEKKYAGGYYGLDTIMPYGKENSADARVLERVINDMVVNYPADSYGMIFFSHASGWLPEGMLNHPRSLVIDYDNGGGNREMEYYDFADAVPDKLFDFIIFEACLMADVMSMYELRNKAEYILASSAEIVAPGFSNIYKDNIMGLFETRVSTQSVVSSFAQSYYNNISSFPETDYRNSATLSLIKMDEMENLALVTKAVLQGVDANEANIIVDDIQSFDRPNRLISSGSRRSRYFDFAHTVRNIVSDADNKTFVDQLERTVVWKASTKNFLLNDRGFYINHHSGLTTYIEQNVYPELNSVYRNSSWYKAIY